MTIFHNIITIILGYIFGSISSAILICKFMKLPNPRNYGSKNPGTTNILRLAGNKIAVIVLIFDFLKGAIPIWIGYNLNISNFYLGITSISSCLGHIYPVFFRFCGGKGVATTFGSFTAISLETSLILTFTWIITVLVSKYISLGSILSAIMLPIYVWWLKPQFLMSATIISFFILLKHTSNIQRLWKHQEKKIWSR